MKQEPWVNRRSAILLAGAVAVPVVGVGGYVAYSGSTYSQGWRMGQLFKLSSRRSWRRVFLQAGEGELSLGQDSSRAEWVGADGQPVQNPWLFSASVEQIGQYEALLGRTVAVRYRQLQKKLTAFNGDTDYRVDEIVAVDPTQSPTGACAIGGSGARSAGTRIGRIVKSTVKGTLVKTHECTVQVGNSGNVFLEMSVPNEAMHDCATATLRSGRPAAISYVETIIRNPLNRDTNYEIVGIRPAEV